jgi:predicted nucleic acid-binding protein
MSRFLADTSCIVASVQPYHSHRHRALGELGRRLDAGAAMVVAAHSLAEAYSVLTRVPSPYRSTPAEAIAALHVSFVEQADVVALDPASYVSRLQHMASDGVAGGRVYDALIAACAVQAKVDTVLTFNERHFRPLLPDSIEVVVPRE